MRTHKKPRWGRYILIAIILIVLIYSVKPRTVTPPSSLAIEQGDTVQSFLQPLSWKQRLWMKLYLRRHAIDATKLETGVYAFSGSYTPASYVEAIMAGPPKDYVRVTVLEGRSIYDIDAMLAKKQMIQAGAFIALAQSKDYITQLAATFPFLTQDKPIGSLEGFLYPDTYFIGTSSDPMRQLVTASLKRFDEKIMAPRRSEGSAFAAAVSTQGVKLSLPGALTLASVVEKEERSAKQKPTIAGIFINRLAQDIQLGADITLCYGYQEPYETCTPSRIVGGLRDSDNLYNTRVHTGLPPTPISSVSEETWLALLRFQKTDYLFYLHDSEGAIHYAATNAEHEQNKARYLQ